jgi:hypothetical protein
MTSHGEAPWGYQPLREILADAAHLQRAEEMKRLGEEVDPDEFAIDIANASLLARLNQR